MNLLSIVSLAIFLIVDSGAAKTQQPHSDYSLTESTPSCVYTITSSQISLTYGGTSTGCGISSSTYYIDVVTNNSCNEGFEVVADYGCTVSVASCDADSSGNSRNCLRIQVTEPFTGFGVIVYALDGATNREAFALQNWPNC